MLEMNDKIDKGDNLPIYKNTEPRKAFLNKQISANVTMFIEKDKSCGRSILESSDVNQLRYQTNQIQSCYYGNEIENKRIFQQIFL